MPEIKKIKLFFLMREEVKKKRSIFKYKNIICVFI